MMSQETVSPLKSGLGSSPGRRTRLQEKEELQNLNNRFVTYIDRVRKLRDEKQRLDVTLEHLQTSTEEETVSVKRVYERELQDARLLIDETAKEKARYQILASKNGERIQELEAELKDIQTELTKIQQELSEAQKHADSLDARYKSAMNEKLSAQQKAQELEEEVDDLRSQLKKIQDTLERETLSKVDLQNQIQSLREDLAFKKKVYEEELTTVRRTGLGVFRDSGGIEETDDDFADRLQAAIDEARDEIEKETEQYRLDLEKTYKAKLEMLENQSTRDSTSISRLDSELRTINSSLSKAYKDITKLQEQNEHLESTVRVKDEDISRLKQIHAEEMSRIMEEMRTLRINYEEKIREYEELLDLRVQLEQEIATLSALLQEEEIRLNLSSTPSREKRTRDRDGAGPRTKKQKKQVAATSSSAAGFIQICDVDPDGRYIQIKNMSDKIEALGGFKIVHEVETTGEKVEFRFHSKSKLQGGASVTVWAAGADGATHSPPTDIIWKSAQSWGSGLKTSTSLCTKSGEVVATFTQRKEVSFSETTTQASSEYQVNETDAGVHTFPSIPETTPVRVVEHQETRQAAVHATPMAGRPRPQVGDDYPLRDEQIFHQQGDIQGDRCVIS